MVEEDDITLSQMQNGNGNGKKQSEPEKDLMAEQEAEQKRIEQQTKFKRIRTEDIKAERELASQEQQLKKESYKIKHPYQERMAQLGKEIVLQGRGSQQQTVKYARDKARKRATRKAPRRERRIPAVMRGQVVQEGRATGLSEGIGLEFGKTSGMSQGIANEFGYKPVVMQPTVQQTTRPILQSTNVAQPDFFGPPKQLDLFGSGQKKQIDFGLGKRKKKNNQSFW